MNKHEYLDIYKKYETGTKRTKWFDNYISKLGLDIDENNLVKINKHNSEIIEKDILHNEDYSINFHQIVFEYFSMKNDGKGFPEKDKNAVLALARMIDLENSTNLWRMKKKNRQALKNIVNYIVSSNEFWVEIRNPKTQIELVDKLNKVAISKGYSEGTNAKSFASKMCKFIDELLNLNVKNYQNAYFINDNVVRTILIYYLTRYDSELKDFEAYRDLIDKKCKHQSYKNKSVSYNLNSLTYSELYYCLTKLKEVTDPNNELTRSEFDHILWYCYRSENIEEENE